MHSGYHMANGGKIWDGLCALGNSTSANGGRERSSTYCKGMTRPSIHSTENFVYKHVDIYFLAGGQARAVEWLESGNLPVCSPLEHSGQPKQAETEISWNRNKCLWKAKLQPKYIFSAKGLFRHVNLLLVYHYFGLKLTENSTNTAGTYSKKEERLKISGLPNILFWPKQSFWP